MKKYLLILICLFLIGCGKNNNINTEKKSNFTAIQATHNNYYMKWFNDEISKNTDKYNEYSIDSSYDIVYSYKDVNVIESYDIQSQIIKSYFIVSSNTDIDSLVKLVIFHDCSVSYDEIDNLINNVDYTEKKGSCTISKYNDNNKISYTITK